MTPDRIESLSKRQRECLRGVAQLKAAGEIATELKIATTTVNSYVADAVRLLGARNRREAARALTTYEGQHPEKHRGDETRVAGEAVDAPPIVPPGTIAPVPSPERAWWERLPIRRKGQADSDLSVASRLLWIPALAVFLEVGFGMLMTGLQIAAAMIESFARALR